MARYSLYVCLLVVCATIVRADDPFEKLKWIQGHWRSEFSGKVFWPTIPTMTYGEEVSILEAPVSRSSGIRFYNFSARAWSHSTKDQLHDEWGFMTITDQGNVTLMTTGNNGFTTYEEGWVDGQKMVLRLKKIGRISFSRDLPVEDLERKFSRLENNYLEQSLRMRTATHPKSGLLDHAVIVYELKKPNAGTTPVPGSGLTGGPGGSNGTNGTNGTGSTAAGGNGTGSTATGGTTEVPSTKKGN